MVGVVFGCHTRKYCLVITPFQPFSCCALVLDDEKKQLLFFTTGCDRVPVGGLANFKFAIAKQVRGGREDVIAGRQYTNMNIIRVHWAHW